MPVRDSKPVELKVRASSVRDAIPPSPKSGLPEPSYTRDANPIPAPPARRVGVSPNSQKSKLLAQKKFEFEMVEKYINETLARTDQRLRPVNFHGFKMDRKRSYKIDGKDLKLSHSFILMWDETENKVIPYMLSHGKDNNIPKLLTTEAEKAGYLGKGSFGRVKIAERLDSTSGEKNQFKQVAIKVLSQKPELIELDCLKAMGQYDLCAQYGPRSKTYLAVDLLPGRELKITDPAKVKAFCRDPQLDPRVHGYYQVGRTLKNISSERWPDVASGISDKVDVARQLAEQLSKLHAAGYAHLDLKGENIRYNPENNTATVIDFGLASRIGERQQVKGTPDYFSPEIAKIADGIKLPERVSGKEDVYTLGMIFAKEMQLQRDPVYGPEFVNLIIRMLQEHPNDRPDMARVAAEINLLIAHKQDESKKSAPKPSVMTSADAGSSSISEELAPLVSDPNPGVTAAPTHILGWLADRVGGGSSSMSSETAPSDESSSQCSLTSESAPSSRDDSSSSTKTKLIL